MIAAAVTGFFRSAGWEIDDSFHSVARGQHARYGCLADVDEDAGLLTFYVYSPAGVPPQRRAAAAEFLTRANYGLRVGNFELDFTDGEVRFKAQAIGSVTEDVVGVVVHHAIAAMDHYYPGLMAVAFGDVSPAAAVESVETRG